MNILDIVAISLAVFGAVASIVARIGERRELGRLLRMIDEYYEYMENNDER